jgi:uncharacterized membrane protein YfcA
MIERAANLALCVFGVFLIAVSLYALARPRRAISLIGKFASTPLVHYSELTFRAIIGAAFIVSADDSPFARGFTIFGVMMLVSALALMLMPRRWHYAYASFWARRMPVAAIYVAAPFTFFGGAALLAIFGP